MPTAQQFLQPAIDGAANYLQVLDGESRQPDTNNPVFQQAALLALSQARSYCKRGLVKDSYCETYSALDEPILYLKESPLASVEEVKLVYPGDPANDVLLVVSEDYVIDLDLSAIRFLTSFTFDSFVTGFDDFASDSTRRLLVKYTGGWSRANKDDNLLGALIQQISANYKRAPVTGLSTITGGGPTGSMTMQSASDRGGLTEAAAMMLDPVIYEGMAIAC